MDFHDHGDEEESDGLLAQINMIPLIDVMLVLLIVFMLSAPLSLSSVDVQLPAGASQASDPDLSKIAYLKIAVSRDGGLYFGEDALSLEELSVRLAEESRRDSEQRLLVRADERVVYARVMAVMNAARRAGLSRVSLVMKDQIDTSSGS